MKRWPTLRILLLGAFGLAVYLKFDTVARLPVWEKLRHPGAWISARLHPPAPAPNPSPVALAFAPDSERVQAHCQGGIRACLDSGFPLGAEPAGQVRAILGKAASRWGLREATSFSAFFARIADPAAAETGWGLQRLEVAIDSGKMVLEKDPARGGSSFCAQGRCLDEVSPHLPLTVFHSARPGLFAAAAIDPGLPVPESPEALFSASGGAGVLPVLRGRVVAVPRAGDTAAWLELHHGRNLFTYYRGLARLASSVRAGAMVEPGDTLGWLEGDTARLELRIESAGTPLDPLAFLGLPASGEDAPHGL